MDERVDDTPDRLFSFIESYVDEWGFAPTNREMGSALNLPSTATVQRHLEKLRDEGKVAWQRGRARTLRIVKETS